ncbi:MAG TPA: HAD-IA family hydrolase [Blastocatellia bacterium]|nr:HAD-IA family hydrolase [Blastocatellia bacterium]
MGNAGFDFITFDCYGTLIDWESGIVDAFRSQAARDGVQLQQTDIVPAYHTEEPLVETGEFKTYREVLAETATRAAARLGWKLEPEGAKFLAASLPTWQPFPDTNSALERLARRFKLGILSNVDDDLIALTRRHFTVDFDPVITAQQVRSYKPAHNHFKAALERLEGKRLLHAAQSYFHDVVPCRELGIPVVWVNRKGELAGAGGPQPNYEVRNLDELADLLGA